jgi:hypothetical protein
LTSHWLSQLGLVLVITAISTWLFVLPAEVHGQVENPYKGVIVYLILPFIVLAGTVLTAAGMVLGRRRVRERLEAEVTDRKRGLQRLISFLVITIGANLVLGTQLTYRAVAYMDTPQVLRRLLPRDAARILGPSDSAHASVACAECHIAPGAGGWVEAKPSGARQVWSTLTGSYRRPVPSALESGRLVPSKETP